MMIQSIFLLLKRRIKYSFILSTLVKVFRSIYFRLKSLVFPRHEHIITSRESVKKYFIKSVSRIIANNLYGLEKLILTKNLSLDNTFIEHGLFFGSYIQEDLKLQKTIDTVITFGAYRKKIIENVFPNKKILTAGAYLLHFDHILSTEERKQLKNDIGKTVLVFPAHSISGMNRVFSEVELVSKVNDMYSNIKTIIICLYYIDYLSPKKETYEQLGCTVTTCGHKFDSFFLNRLKTLIDLADYTVSNKLGTHVGYCLSMNKPHHYIESGQFSEVALNSEGEREINSSHKTDNDAKDIELEFNELFKVKNEDITPSQYKFYEKYFR